MESSVKGCDIVLFHSHGKTKRSGGNTYIDILIKIFSSLPEISLLIVYTDCEEVSELVYEVLGSVEIIKIPQPVTKLFLSYYRDIIQEKYCERLVNVIYPFLKEKKKLVCWFNNPDDINLLLELRKAFQCIAVYTLHSWAWKELINRDDSFFYQKAKKVSVTNELHNEFLYSQLKMCHEVDKVITVTEYSKKVLTEIFKFPFAKIITIYNGILYSENVKVNKRVAKKEFGFAPDDKIIIYVGRITQNKGVNFLIDAFKLLYVNNPACRLLLIGPGTSDDFSQSSFSLAGRISFTGQLDKEALYKLYSIADIGIVPSLFEQCSLTSIEMRLHKIPVIVTAIEGLDEMFIDNFDCLKVPISINEIGEREIDIEKLARKMETVLRDINKRVTLSYNSYKRGITIFGYEQMNRNYTNFISDLCMG